MNAAEEKIFKQAALVTAADAGYLNQVTALLDKGVSPDAEDEFGDTALGQALHRGNIAIVETLLAAGADASRPSAQGDMPLKMAVIASVSDGLKEAALLALVNAGADVQARDIVGVTSLHWAIEMKAESAVRVLISHGADVNAAAGDDAETPLMLAVRNKAPAIADLLLAAGAVLDKRNRLGATAADIAEAGTEVDSLLRAVTRERSESAARMQAAKTSLLKSRALRIKPRAGP